MKKEFKQRFKASFPNYRLLAIQLNGFSHKAFYDLGSKDSPIRVIEYSGYMSDCEIADKETNDKAKAIFQGIGHLSYQHNPEEIIYLLPNER